MSTTSDFIARASIVLFRTNSVAVAVKARIGELIGKRERIPPRRPKHARKAAVLSLTFP